MLVTKNTTEEAVKNKLIAEIKKGEWDKEEIEVNGAWVYRDGINRDWMFKRFDKIADALRMAIKTDGAKVLCNGKEILFDQIDDSRAYYISYNDDVKIVKIA